jgi:sugar lactone lactonase YvrE
MPRRELSRSFRNRPERAAREIIVQTAVLAAIAASAGACGKDSSSDESSGGSSSTSTGGTTGSTGAPAETSTTAPAESSGPPEETSAPGSSSEDGSNDGGATTGEYDCAALPPLPLTYEITTGPIAQEDFAFDHLGNMIGASNGNLFKSLHVGAPILWVTGAGGFVSGLRATSDGIFVWNDVDSGTLKKVNDAGAAEPVLSGLQYPNGLEVDLEGNVYIAENSGARVRKVNAISGEFTTLADGLDNPNGVSFSPDYSILYVGSFGGGSITAVHVDENMNMTSVEPFYEGIGGGGLDGMAVDACGNVYVCEFGPAIVWRIPPDGSALEVAVDLGMATGWIPNMQFGSGYGGWNLNTLYVIEIGATQIFEVPVGVPDKTRGYP